MSSSISPKMTCQQTEEIQTKFSKELFENLKDYGLDRIEFDTDYDFGAVTVCMVKTVDVNQYKQLELICALHEYGFRKTFHVAGTHYTATISR